MVVKKKKSEKRIKGKIIPVRVSDVEEEVISKKAKEHSLPPSTYLRMAGLNKRIKNTVDSQLVIEVGRLRADLGRLGGLLKAWLSPSEPSIGTHPEGQDFIKKEKKEVQGLLKQIEQINFSIEEALKKRL